MTPEQKKNFKRLTTEFGNKVSEVSKNMDMLAMEISESTDIEEQVILLNKYIGQEVRMEKLNNSLILIGKIKDRVRFIEEVQENLNNG